MAGFDVFGYPLAPDTYATSEKALQEAMWAGVPPVVLPHGGVIELVEDGVTGLVAASEQDYPDAVARVLLDGDLRRRLGSQAQRWVRAAHDPVRWARAAVRLVEEVSQEPRRARAVLPGGADPAAGCFVRSLGAMGRPFAISAQASMASEVDPAAVQLADEEIAASGTSLAKGEGGVLHYRNTFPDDAHLRFWSGLILAAAGRSAEADTEFRAAQDLGLADGRPEHHRAVVKANESR